MKEISLNTYKKSEVVCSIILILLIVIVPRYINLPNNIELLFHDRIGQVLLLLIAIFIGSYNLLCGVLLVILFLSIMLKPTEGFDSTPDELPEDFEDSPEDFADSPEETEETQAAKPSPRKSSSMTPPPRGEDDAPGPKNTQPIESKSEDKELNKDRQISAYKSAINSMQSKIDDLEKEKTPKKTQAPENTPTQTKPTEMTEYQEQKRSSNNSQKAMMTPPPTQPRTPKNTPPKPESFDDTIEGFSCGCSGSNSSQVKLIKYTEANSLDSSLDALFERFENPKPNVITPNPFDVAGCRFDMKENNPLHETVNGAPVSSCAAYSKNNSQTGTVFYPLNAF
jgi:hypothetical protein